MMNDSVRLSLLPISLASVGCPGWMSVAVEWQQTPLVPLSLVSGVETLTTLVYPKL